MRRCSFAVLLFLSTQSAFALSGAEFLAQNKDFSEGYAWGVLDQWLTPTTEDDATVLDWKKRRGSCFDRANVNSENLYDATRAQIQKKPKLMSIPAWAAVVDTAIEICP